VEADGSQSEDHTDTQKEQQSGRSETVGYLTRHNRHKEQQCPHQQKIFSHNLLEVIFHTYYLILGRYTTA
jgi:hypothetical protein